MKTKTNGRELDAVDRKAKVRFHWRAGTRARIKRGLRRRFRHTAIEE